MGTKKLLLFFFCSALIFAFVSFSACGKTHTHVFKETVVAPTPTDYGYTLHTCEGCGYIYADNFTSASGQDIVVPGEGTEGLQFYPLDGDQYAVAAGEAIYLSDIVIPSKHNGKPVTTIADNGFQSCANLTKVTIPSSVTSIGSRAFSGCGKLTSITIPNSVTSICERAFSGCGSLTSITIPNSVKTIGDYAFSGCSSLTSIAIPNNVTSIGYCAFGGCSSLTSVTIGSGVTTLGEMVFYNCSSLTSVTIPNSVTSIGEWAFYECGSLTSVTIGSGVMSIGNYAFGDCSSLTSINFSGTTAQWNAISKGSAWAGSVPSACKIYCTDDTLNV